MSEKHASCLAENACATSSSSHESLFQMCTVTLLLRPFWILKRSLSDITLNLTQTCWEKAVFSSWPIHTTHNKLVILLVTCVFFLFGLNFEEIQNMSLNNE